MQVPYELKPSSIAGTGLFATERIARGALLWLYSPSSVTEHDEPSLRAKLARLSASEQVVLCEHVYTWQGKVIEIHDDSKFWNHASLESGQNTGNHPDAELGEGDGMSSYALRDIEPGEEFLDDYSSYDEIEWFEDICRHLGAKSCVAVGLAAKQDL